MPAFACAAPIASRSAAIKHASPSLQLCSQFVHKTAAGRLAAARSEPVFAATSARFDVSAQQTDEPLVRRRALAGLALALAAAAAPSAARADDEFEFDLTGYATGELNVRYKDVKVGDASGPSIDVGNIVTVILSEGGDESDPISFKYGKSEMPLGLELGIKTMKPGGRRQIVLPPELNPKPTERNKAVGIDVELVSVTECVEKKALGFVTFKECK